MAPKGLRWGILGCGLISSDFVYAVKGLPANEHQLVAVAARQLQSATNFANKFGIPKAYGNYEELVKDPNVEIAYVGTYSANHYELVTKLLENGKHVLCEKPLVLNAKHAKDLVALARKKQLFFMEAVWSRCFPAYRRIVEELSSGALGEVIQVNATFGNKLDHQDRLITKESGGGALGEIGIYTLQLTSLAFGGKKPEKIVAVGQVNESGVDLCESVSIFYGNGGSANLTITMKQKLPNAAYIIGTKGVIKLEEPFWCATTLVLPNGNIYNAPLPNIDGEYNFTNSQGLAYEAQEVARCIRAGLKESPLITLDESILLAEIRDEIWAQLGVKYE